MPCTGLCSKPCCTKQRLRELQPCHTRTRLRGLSGHHWHWCKPIHHYLPATRSTSTSAGAWLLVQKHQWGWLDLLLGPRRRDMNAVFPWLSWPGSQASIPPGVWFIHVPYSPAWGWGFDFTSQGHRTRCPRSRASWWITVQLLVPGSKSNAMFPEWFHTLQQHTIGGQGRGLRKASGLTAFWWLPLHGGGGISLQQHTIWRWGRALPALLRMFWLVLPRVSHIKTVLRALTMLSNFLVALLTPNTVPTGTWGPVFWCSTMMRIMSQWWLRSSGTWLWPSGLLSGWQRLILVPQCWWMAD